jgi:LacI family transcriptional regulator
MHHFFLMSLTQSLTKQRKRLSSDHLAVKWIIRFRKKQVELLINKRDGILMSLSNESNNDDHIQQIVDRNTLCHVWQNFKTLQMFESYYWWSKAAFNAVQHLIDNGCKKIAHIRGPLNPKMLLTVTLVTKKTLEKKQYTIWLKTSLHLWKCHFSRRNWFCKSKLLKNIQM